MSSTALSRRSVMKRLSYLTIKGSTRRCRRSSLPRRLLFKGRNTRRSRKSRRRMSIGSIEGRFGCSREMQVTASTGQRKILMMRSHLRSSSSRSNARRRSRREGHTREGGSARRIIWRKRRTVTTKSRSHTRPKTWDSSMKRHFEILTSNSYWNKRLSGRMLSRMNSSRANLFGLKNR